MPPPPGSQRKTRAGWVEYCFFNVAVRDMRGEKKIVRHDLSRSILHSVAASSGDDDVEFVAPPPGTADHRAKSLTPTAVPPARQARGGTSWNAFLLRQALRTASYSVRCPQHP